MRRPVRSGGFIILLLAISCGPLPRDPEGTLERVRRERVRVGLVENAPWVIRTAGEPAGAEVELVRGLAAELGTTPEWYWGGEQQHMEALKSFELDLVVGGLTAKTAWAAEVGLTSPYFEDRIVVGVPASVEPPREIKGVEVAAKRGEAVAGYLEREGAVPVRVDDLSQAGGPAAARDWQLEALGFTPAAVELAAEQHVMAIPPGENGWLKRVEEFLQSQRSQVKWLLQNAEARP